LGLNDDLGLNKSDKSQKQREASYNRIEDLDIESNRNFNRGEDLDIESNRSFNQGEALDDSEFIQNPNEVAMTDFEAKVVELTNKFRVANGRDPLEVRENLMDTARKSSDIMDACNNLKHGYTSGWMGENIAMGQTSPEEVVQGWINSPGHRENMLRSNFTAIGVGDSSDKSGAVYWTQQFS
jgi:uncharacterized protein YkwD